MKSVYKILISPITFIIFALSIALVFNVSAQQNMVTNPSFEQFRQCPEKANTALVPHYEIATRWYTVSAASPDYFNACAKNNQVSVPRNFAGYQQARTGNGYIGLILKSDPKYYHGSKSYTEHIQNKLSSPLKKDRLYCFEIWICLGKNSTIKARDFGVYFSKEQITFPNPPDSLPLPHITYQGEEYLGNSHQWVPMRGVYKAEGGERYLTIGNFQPWLPGRFERLRDNFTPVDLREFAYYIFDDVSLKEIKDPSLCDCNMVVVEQPKPPPTPPIQSKTDKAPEEEFEQVKVGETFVLKNIFFDFDKSDLLPTSFPELDKLVALMKKYPNMTLEIGGHTDYKGSVEYNIRLSNDRANAVVKHLVAQGIDAKRLTWKGYGKSEPIADNTTEEGRQLNRRVEFKVITK
jgi:OmpA-OmpF porin, OOP family